MRVLSAQRPDRLVLRGDSLKLPGFVPAVTGTGPLDRMIWPHLPRVAPLGVLVSAPSFFMVHHEPAPLPRRLWIDGGSFGLFSHGGTWTQQVDGTASLLLRYDDLVVEVTCAGLLALQKRHAAVGFTLDIPIPAGCGAEDAGRRLRASVENAKYAAEHRDGVGFLLYGSLPLGDDREATLAALDDLLALPLDGLALGGVAGRREAWDASLAFVRRVRRRLGRLPLHVFGVGAFDRVREIQEAGADTVDSSSPLRAALDGRLCGSPGLGLEDPSPIERMQLALTNIARLSCAPLGPDLAALLFGGRVARLAAARSGEGLEP
jgi:tRNA-guanine family transglycosylase